VVRLDFGIPDYMGGPLPYGQGDLHGRISRALADAHVRAVEGSARKRSPVRTGRLRDSISARLRGSAGGVLEATAPYAKYLHEGTGIYGPRKTPIAIEPKAKRALSWPGAAHPVRRVRQSGIKPRDFLRVAVLTYYPSLLTLGIAIRLEVIEIFARNYFKLKEAGYYLRNLNDDRELKGQKRLKAGTVDKYFHCKANCEAAQLGYVAEAFLASLAKEGFDQTIDNLSRALISHKDQHSVGDSIDDMAANLKGVGKGIVASFTPCGASCSEYRPQWLPEDMW
jgi:hypothetical protein